MKKGILSAVACALLLTGVACRSGENNQESANENVSARTDIRSDSYTDPEITTLVKLALIGDLRTNAFDILVEARDGVVILSGAVDSMEVRGAAEEVSRGTQAAQQIDNRLQVTPEVRRRDISVTDEQITDAIEKAMERDPDLADLSIAAYAEKGVVTLNGSVEDRQGLLKAAESIREIPGVKAVVTTQVNIGEL